MSVPGQESEQSGICIRGIDLAFDLKCLIIHKQKCKIYVINSICTLTNANEWITALFDYSWFIFDIRNAESSYTINNLYFSSYRMITLFLSKNNINGYINNFNETVSCHLSYYSLGHHGRDCMVVGFTRRGVLDTILYDKVCQWPATGRWWFSPGTLVSSTSKTDCHDITEILLKVALYTITLTLKLLHY
jgi:hypothetical protein